MKANNWVQLLIILLGLPLGAFLSNRAYLMHESLEHAIPLNHTKMDHGLLDISGDKVIPTLDSLIIEKDEMSGWNIEISTSNFEFAPLLVNRENIVGKGHAHVYINDEKFARIYGHHFHIPNLLGNGHKIKVTLNANGHETLAIGDKPIEIERALP